MKQPVEEAHAAIRETGTNALATPFACAHCGTAQHHHGWQYLPAVGLHQWQRPTEDLMKQRMLARRAAAEQAAADISNGLADMFLRLGSPTTQEQQ